MSFFRNGWVKWRTVKGDAELAAAGQPITLVLPTGRVAYRGALALARAEARQGQAGHRQPAAARQLPQGRRTSRDVHVVVAGRAGVAGDRGPHLRGVRARRAALDGLPDLRHHLVPGLRRLQRGVRLDQHRHRRHRRPGPARRGRAAGVHAVLLQQRRVQRRRLAALPRREGRPVRRVVRQHQHQLDPAPHRRQRREELPGHRHPDLDRRRHPRRQRRLGRPRAGHDAHGHRRLGHDHRRGVPAPRRAEVELVHDAGELTVSQFGVGPATGRTHLRIRTAFVRNAS